MSLFTKYTVVTDGEKWAVKKTDKEGEVEFLDTQNGGFWWGRDSEHFEDCWTDEATARRDLRRWQA